jgi:tetratricopeptide (TPR) repeat protein
MREMRYLPFWPTIALVVFLAACSSTPPREEEPDTERQSLQRSAQLAFSQGQYAQAVTLYGAALDEAMAEDRAAEIVDLRFNIALSQMYVGQYENALLQVAKADAERLRRGLGPDPELRLLEATIRFRAGDLQASRSGLTRLLSMPGLNPATAAKGHFVAGLIAAELGDDAQLRRHLAGLRPSAEPGVGADRLELEARLAVLAGDVAAGLEKFDQAITLRAIERDYRGMARALAGAGKVAEQAGQPGRAAGYFLRAGRSATQRAEADAAAWLEQAIRLGRLAGDEALVVEASALLDQPGARRPLP